MFEIFLTNARIKSFDQFIHTINHLSRELKTSILPPRSKFSTARNRREFTATCELLLKIDQTSRNYISRYRIMRNVCYFNYPRAIEA